MTHRPNTDATGKNADERFCEIRKYFFECLKFCGQRSRELYYRPKPGEARQPTEEELVRRWAGTLDVPVNEILIGIQRAFAAGAERGRAVTNFRECTERIRERLAELREARAGEGWR